MVLSEAELSREKVNTKSMIIYCRVTAFILGSISRSLFSLIQFPVLHPSRLLIIVVSSGNQTQVLLPHCDHFVSEPAGSAASEERAPYCSGEGLTGQKTLFIPQVDAPLSHFSLLRQQAAPLGGRGRSLRWESGDP